MGDSVVSHSPSSNTESSTKDPELLFPRSYQNEIIEQAKWENLIVCLPTGSGKTYIAVMLTKILSSITTRRSLKDDGKRTILLVKTVELARQHCRTMQIHIGVQEVGIYHSSSKTTLQNTEWWFNEFETHSVLIFTVQIFLNLLSHNLFSLDKVNLLIFDECHHATGNDPYAMIMKDHFISCRDRPRILGLTASISGQKIEPHKLEKVAKDLENLFYARIETGSDRMEIARNSTSVKVKHQTCANYEQKVCAKSKTVMTIFKEIKVLSDELNKREKKRKESENNPLEIVNSSNFLQLKCRTLDQLKSHLDNIIHIGYDLGLYGVYLGITALMNSLESRNTSIAMTDQSERDLYNKIMDKLGCLINDQLKDLIETRQFRFSDKVLKVEEFIKENSHGQTIVFVDRVYTAAFLCKILTESFGDSKKIKYLAGSKAGLDEGSMSTKYQREVAHNFRKGQINVLISTAIVEEGLDVATCNLVIRFNKPQNFSSYMQSKGRARATDGKAVFVLLRDEIDVEARSKNTEEYDSYEYMEKMLKRSFKTSGYEDSTDDDDDDSLVPYRPGNGVKIGGIRAVEIIYIYCAVLGDGQILSPRFCFHLSQSNKFKCILSMPGNCPMREDVICENRNKRSAKQECCLKMVEKLHKIGELDERCLPIRPDRCIENNNSDSDDDETNESSIPVIDKQIAYFPPQSVGVQAQWHLYRIRMSNNVDLGFVVPCELIKLPIFQLYESDCEFQVEIVYLKPIDFTPYRDELEVFCRYIFENVFDRMNTGVESLLRFDIEHSTFQLLPCLLTQSGELDHQRMTFICTRKDKLITNPSELNDQEVYIHLNSTDKELLVHVSDGSLSKLASHPWDHKKKLAETIQTYADHFEYKMPGILIQRDFPMAVVNSLKKLRINYLKDSSLKDDKESTPASTKPRYYPIEVLRYAPLNQSDFELIYKLPSVLIRICQLSYIEQLRKLFANHIQSDLLFNDDRMSVVNFRDCLPRIFSSNQFNALPLVSLHYKYLSTNNSRIRLSSGLLFQSTTRHSTAEATDMENLEILGDCFLKLAMSMALYHQYPSENAGKLTPRKDKQVSNENLYRLATKKELTNYLSANAVRYGKKEANWLPPGYTVAEEGSDRYLKQRAKRKAFADMIEALIGAFLISTDYFTTIKFMSWLGLDVIPKTKNDQIMETPSVLHPGLSGTVKEMNERIEKFFVDQAFDVIEKSIEYTFKNKAYLIAAFTHPSYSNNNPLTQCYDRLEYLGDAVLDFLVIRCIFVEYYDQVTPSRVTDIRQDLANNGRLAYLLVSRGLDTKILQLSEDLFFRMKIYLQDETIFPKKDQSTKEKLSNEIDQWANSTAPKPLADVFEALVGAIFLDCGYSLETVWRIIEPILRRYIDASVAHPSLNPKRSFHEHQGEILKESMDEDGQFICHVRLPDGKEFTGYGKNKKLAKHDACRKAMNSS